MKLKQKNRLPSFLPEWFRDRIEVNTYKLNRFMRWASMQIPEGGILLDAGAGEGRFSHLFRHTKYIGVDLAVGDSDWDYSNLHVIANLTEMPFKRGSFDAVICTQVIEHVTEPRFVLDEISRVLKVGGHLFLTAPQSWHQHQKPHDYFRYTSFGLQYLIENSNLQIESIEPMGGYFWYLSFQLQNIVHWIFYNRPRTVLNWPIRAGLGLIFQFLLPLILFYLDGLDPIKDETFGYQCVALKPLKSMEP